MFTDHVQLKQTRIIKSTSHNPATNHRPNTSRSASTDQSRSIFAAKPPSERKHPWTVSGRLAPKKKRPRPRPSRPSLTEVSSEAPIPKTRLLHSNPCKSSSSSLAQKTRHPNPSAAPRQPSAVRSATHAAPPTSLPSPSVTPTKRFPQPKRSSQETSSRNVTSPGALPPSPRQRCNRAVQTPR